MPMIKGKRLVHAFETIGIEVVIQQGFPKYILKGIAKCAAYQFTI